jgi:hypothetical protein
MWPVKLLCLCLLLPSSAIAADYYFAANGNDLNACTQAQPCRSIAKINALINSAMPGDTFYLRGGQVFDGGNTRCIDAFDIDGTSGNPITIRSYGEGRAILQNCRPITTIHGTLTDWWVIKNLEVRNSNSAIRCHGCTNWLVQSNAFHHMDAPCAHHEPDAPLNTSPARLTYRHNVCYEAGLKKNGEGFYFRFAKGVVIEHNEFFHLRDEGVSCKSSCNNIVVRHNYFHDFYAPDGSLLASPARLLVTQGFTPSEDTAVNARVEANTRITTARNWVENMPFEGIRKLHSQYATTLHNVIIGTGGAAIAYKSGAKGQIAYNTLYNNGSAYLNEFAIPTTNDISWSNGIGNDATNPLFFNALANDFNLRASSNRINKGADRLSKGVFHSPTLKTCKVNGPITNTVHCEVGPIRFPPLRCPKPTAFIVKVNGQPRKSVTCRVVAGKMIDVTFSGSGVQQTDTLTLSASYGALQDSAWIGGRTTIGRCLAAPAVCNSMLLPVRHKPVSKEGMTDITSNSLIQP